MTENQFEHIKWAHKKGVVSGGMIELLLDAVKDHLTSSADEPEYRVGDIVSSVTSTGLTVGPITEIRDWGDNFHLNVRREEVGHKSVVLCGCVLVTTKHIRHATTAEKSLYIKSQEGRDDT